MLRYTLSVYILLVTYFQTLWSVSLSYPELGSTERHPLNLYYFVYDLIGRHRSPYGLGARKGGAFTSTVIEYKVRPVSCEIL